MDIYPWKISQQHGDIWVDTEEMEVIKKIYMTLRQKEKRIKPLCATKRKKTYSVYKKIMDIIAVAVAEFERLMPSLLWLIMITACNS